LIYSYTSKMNEEAEEAEEERRRRRKQTDDGDTTEYDALIDEKEEEEEEEEDDDSKTTTTRDRPQKSIEGWVVIVTGVHEESQEEDVHERFGDFGEIQNVHLNLDRQTGYVKGYCLIEYKDRAEAKRAIDEMDGQELLGERVRVDWAFVKKPDAAAPRASSARDGADAKRVRR